MVIFILYNIKANIRVNISQESNFTLCFLKDSLGFLQ